MTEQAKTFQPKKNGEGSKIHNILEGMIKFFNTFSNTRPGAAQ